MSRKAKKAAETHPIVQMPGLKLVIEGGIAEVHGFKRHDGGYHWLFKREGREYPLSLSAAGMAEMSQIYHQLVSGYPPVPNKPEDPA